MYNFEKVWEKFNYIIEEMQDGVCFFEGYILNVSMKKLEEGIKSLCTTPFNAMLDYSVWSDESTKEEWAKSYKPEQYLDLFKANKIICLQPEYLTIQHEYKLHIKLMIDTIDDKTTIEIICYRDPILDSKDPKQAIDAAIMEFIRLKKLFGGSSLFIGPDTLSYPEDDQTYPDEWIKVPS